MAPEIISIGWCDGGVTRGARCRTVKLFLVITISVSAGVGTCTHRTSERMEEKVERKKGHTCGKRAVKRFDVQILRRYFFSTWIISIEKTLWKKKIQQEQKYGIIREGI